MVANFARQSSNGRQTSPNFSKLHPTFPNVWLMNTNVTVYITADEVPAPGTH